MLSHFFISNQSTCLLDSNKKTTPVQKLNFKSYYNVGKSSDVFFSNFNFFSTSYLMSFLLRFILKINACVLKLNTRCQFGDISYICYLGLFLSKFIVSLDILFEVYKDHNSNYKLWHYYILKSTVYMFQFAHTKR